MTLRLLSIVAVLGMVATSCGGARTCDPTNCTGCCSADGSCVVVPTALACGSAANLCVVCQITEECVSGLCVSSSGTGGGSAGGGTAGGLGGGSAGGSAGGHAGGTGGGSAGGGTAGGVGGGTAGGHAGGTGGGSAGGGTAGGGTAGGSAGGSAGGHAGGTGGAGGIPASADTSRDLLSTSLEVNVTTRVGTAVISLAGSTTSTGASFEVGDLTIQDVRNAAGALNYQRVGKQLDVGVPTSSSPTDITIKYGYGLHTNFDGAIALGSMTFTWPYFCGNLFPCKSNPADGLKFNLHLTGVPTGKMAVYPTTIPADAPAYLLAWAIGDFTELPLGTTAAGTAVSIWYPPGSNYVATVGGAHLKDVFAWYETNLGPYQFGAKVGSVQADWDVGAAGGMEHHPFWHIAPGDMVHEEVHAHEAAHGWFGDGVRIKCWEDFVLSEGTVSYLAAVSLGAVVGASTEAAVWTSYQNRLTAQDAQPVNKIAWPASCGSVDVLTTLYTDITYMKGAFFFSALEKKVGRPQLISALAHFYTTYKGKAAGMQELLDIVKADTGYDPQSCALWWLRSNTIPYANFCS